MDGIHKAAGDTDSQPERLPQSVARKAVRYEWGSVTRRTATLGTGYR